jgi:methyltransferase (TIGR00027 family)
MKPGRASKTAELVCMGRALAHGTTSVARFSDPTALALLPEAARARVEEMRAQAPGGLVAGLRDAYFRKQSELMVARTIEIDDAIREAASPQVVILGAGLDGRAWRMPELRDAIVFEVDHPDSQRDKRARAAALTRVARELRFVPVDFTRDSLDAALDAAGHDPTVPTTWIWEGVVMYLRLSEVESSLRMIARRSAPNSRLIIAYHSRTPLLLMVGPIVRMLGEPLRSTFSADAMRALLTEHGFRVVRDRGLPELASALSPALGRSLRSIRHLRIVTADVLR